MKQFINCHVPINTCNLRYSYCYVTQNEWLNATMSKFDCILEYIGYVLSKKRLGKFCDFNMYHVTVDGRDSVKEIPILTDLYYEIRDGKVDQNGENCLNTFMRECLGEKLYEDNEQYTKLRKSTINVKNKRKSCAYNFFKTFCRKEK